jgi:hypothetical protein
MGEVIVDSTGLRLVNSSSWYDIRIGRKNKRKDNIKLHVLYCGMAGLILDFRITDWKRYDSPVFRQLIRDLRIIEKANRRFSLFVNKELQACLSRKRDFLTSILKVIALQGQGIQKAWKQMVRSFFEKMEQWLSVYNIRSFVEAIFSSLKRCFG